MPYHWIKGLYMLYQNVLPVLITRSMLFFIFIDFLCSEYLSVSRLDSDQRSYILQKSNVLIDILRYERFDIFYFYLIDLGDVK